MTHVVPGLVGYLGAPTAEVQICSQDTPCEICDGDSGTGTGIFFFFFFFVLLQFSTVNYHNITVSWSFTYRLGVGQWTH